MAEWVRYGECNHCGWCCDMLSRQYVVRMPTDPRWAHFYRTRGFVPHGLQVARFGWLYAPCPEHQNGRCAVQSSKPERCEEFPTMPTDIVATPCSYWFESGSVKVGGMGSPHPCTEEELMRVETEVLVEGLA